MYFVTNRFLVKSKHQRDFIKETKTIWIGSYKKSKRGFVKTMILKNRKNPDEFLTIDIWKSKKDADRFFASNLQRLLKASHVPKRYLKRESFSSAKYK